MRKTNSRSRSFNAGTNDVPLLNANTDYYSAASRKRGEIGEDENELDNNEYNVVRRTSSAATSSQRRRLRPHESRASDHPRSAGTQHRRLSQQFVSSPTSVAVLKPELVITSSSKISKSAPSPSLSSFPYSRGDKVDFFIRNYQDAEEADCQSRYPQTHYARRKTIQVENASTDRLQQEERRWSSESTARIREKQDPRYYWTDQDGCHRGQAYYKGTEAHQRRDHSGPAQVPLLAIVTSSSPIAARSTRRSSIGPEIATQPEEPYFERKNSYLLSVPGDDYSSPSVPSHPTDTHSARLRSHSTPTSPELLAKNHGCIVIDTEDRNQGQLISDPIYSIDQTRLSPDRYSDSQEEIMHSPYHAQRRRTHLDGYARHYQDNDSLGDYTTNQQIRKHSYADVPSDSAQRSRQMAELRRIASSATCGMGNIDNGQRRRVLPPTPDQVFENHQRIHINYPSPRGYGRTVAEDRRISSSVSSLPSQQASTQPYCSIGFEYDQGASNSNSRRSSSGNSCRQIASSELGQASFIEHRMEKAQSAVKKEHQLRGQQVFQFSDNRGRNDDEEDTLSFPRARRATAFADSAMIPSSTSSTPNSSNSPRIGRGRKLPEAPADSNMLQSPSGKTAAPAIARQKTVGDLLRQPQSPTSLERYNPPPRRVSEQIFTGNAKMGKGLLTRQESKSAGGDCGKANSTNAMATKPGEPYPFQIPPSRSNVGSLGQFRQSSVSSSSSVPDLITTPPNATGASPATTDAATDSGHGSGPESAVGDGATVCGSNSWPDAIGTPAGATGPPVSADGLLTPPSAGLGLLHFTIQYFPVRKRLRVSVIKAERLAGQLRMDLELHTFVKLCLMPGKIQKQRGSRIVKRTRDATFNEEFFFDNITMEDLETKWVYLRLCHHVGKQFQRNVIIGQLDVSLKDITLQLMGKQEVKLCQELKPKQLKKLGRLQISTCLEHDARRLTINIFRVDDLPKFGISGPPDPFVRISVDQNGKAQTKQSRTLKSTCNAVFREAIMFLVSTRKEDLEGTNIVITVHDGARAASGDDVIGRVYLGQLASDKMEMDQWRNTVMNPGREFKATHQLKREQGDDETSNIND